jgi:hypothetical protein
MGRPKRRWVDNIKMDLRETGRGEMCWIDLAQNVTTWRIFVNGIMKFRDPYNVGKLLSSCTTSGVFE